MTLLDEFRLCLGGDWAETPDGVTYRMEGRIMVLQSSSGRKDWLRNINILPTIRKISGVRMILPLGLSRAWDTLKPIIDEHKPDSFIGYSHGAFLAALGSAHTGRSASCFGCPGVAVMTKKVAQKFSAAFFYSGYRDLFTFIQFLYEHGDNEKVLFGVIKRGKEKLIPWLSGHSPSIYKQLLEGLN